MYEKSKGYRYLFGPVPSRRLGRSLGVDIIPHKICTLNCIYCEVGRTTSCTTERQRFYDPDEIIAELREFYPGLKDGLDIVTITGAGEPTLSSDLGYIINEAKKFVDIPVGVLTNSTLMTDENVRRELRNADVVVPSIDAATKDTYKHICAPHRSLDIEEINRALIDFSKEYKGRLLIEILLCRGVNDNRDEIEKIADVIKQCDYEIVQLNTVHRPPAFSRAVTVAPEFLIDTALYLKSKGINVEPVGNYIRDFSGGSMTADEMERLLSMRPCSVKDISMVFGVTESLVQEKLKDAGTDNFEITDINGENFYFKK
ncbi:MAG: radical SAM protein [Deferribacterales bacterium]